MGIELDVSARRNGVARAFHVAVTAGLLLGCTKARSLSDDGPPDGRPDDDAQGAGAGGGAGSGTGGARDTGAGGASGRTGGAGGAGGARDAGSDLPTTPTCLTGTHLCASTCVSNIASATCGTSCTPCPAPANGAATCDGTSCGFTCASGSHPCGSTCASNSSVTSCGASCVACPTVANGAYSCLPTGACALACAAGFLECDGSARSCTGAAWSFESGTAEGFQLLSLVGNAADGISVSTVRAADGTQALAIPSTFNCTRTAFEVVLYPCGLGTPVNLQGKTLRFQVYLDGPALLDGPKQGSALVIASGGQTVDLPLSAGQWIPAELPLTATSNAAADGFGFELYMVPTGPPPGSVCLQWAGTVYLDAFSVQ